MHDWYYLQLFLQQGTRFTIPPQQLVTLADTLLVDSIQCWIETLRDKGWITRYFFIRYAEGGYHVRLRVHGQPQLLHTQVQPFLQHSITDFYQAHATELELPAAITFNWLQNSGYVQIGDYEPEYTKYGGAKGMPLAEEHFDMSSQVALSVMSAARESGVAHGQYALDLLKGMLQAYSANPLEHAFILKGHTTYWLMQMPLEEQDRLKVVFEGHFQKQRERFALRLQQSLLQSRWPDTIETISAKWQGHLTTHFAQLKKLEEQQALYSPMQSNYLAEKKLWNSFPTIQETPTVGLLLLPNYIHVLCNRLGLSLMQEAQLTYLLYRSIETEHVERVYASPVRLEPDLGNIF